MTLHRCSQCTLMRCSAPGMTCDECLAYQAKGLKSDPSATTSSCGGTTLTYSFPTPTLGSTTGLTTVAARATLRTLNGLSQQEQADVVFNWVTAFSSWGRSHKGYHWWHDVACELSRIAAGGIP